jgi:uncharacterized protein (DUF427 family)
MPLVRSSGSRALRIGLFVAFLAAGAVVCAPLAGAQSASDTNAAALRAEADSLSSRYFSALERVQTLDADIAHNQQTVADLSARAKQARADARARALVAYTNSGTQLAALIDGADSLDTARRAHLIDRVNAHDQAVYTKLHAATRELSKQQRILQETRQAQATALSELRDQGAAIDAKLAQAEQQEQAAATAASAAQADLSLPRAAPRLHRHPGHQPAPRRPVPVVRASAGERGQLRRGQPGRALSRRLPVPPVHLERDRQPRRPVRPGGAPPQPRLGLRPGRDGVGPLPVAGHGAVGRCVPVTDPHRTDPHRITVDPVPGTVRVTVDGTTIAESKDTLLLQEGSLPPRYYLPRDDVRTELLVASESRTTCPFKGAASYWTLELDGVRHEDLVWSYEEPIVEMAKIAGRLSFYNERAEIVVEPVNPR